MAEDKCDCCEPAEAQTSERTPATDRWLTERPVSDAPLPPDMASIASRLYGTGSVETLDDFVTATRVEASGGSIGVEDLCRVTEETPHVAETAHETYYFRCFYDGIALAYLTGEPVDVRTESPSGSAIEFQASPDGDVAVTPSETVMSFGITTTAPERVDDELTVEAVYEAVCPYVKAFPSQERYESWAAGVDGATVGLPLTAGMPIAAALTGAVFSGNVSREWISNEKRTEDERS